MPRPQTILFREPPQPLRVLIAEDTYTKCRTADLQRGVPSRERAVMPTRSTPEDGDIVVLEEKRGGTLVHVLHTAPGADQYEFRRREEGIAQALALAKRQYVRAWLTDEGYDFVLLEDFREVELV